MTDDTFPPAERARLMHELDLAAERIIALEAGLRPFANCWCGTTEQPCKCHNCTAYRLLEGAKP